MPELRHDFLTGRLVLLAPGRAARPYTSAQTTDAASASTCPFCPGHESETPPEVARTGPGEPETPGWRVRVVPNLYPIVGGAEAEVGATGAHEVIVLSPAHDRGFGALSDDEAVEVLTMMQTRSRAQAAAGRAYVQLLINQGRAAGASIAHPHAQMLALDFVPPAVSVSVERFRDALGDPVVEDQGAAVAAGGDVVVGTEVCAWCPTGAAAPFETRVAALGAGPRFASATDGEIFGVALVLRDVLAALARELGEVPYNVVVHDAPSAGHVPDVQYHWWIEVLPRTAVVAGFELGTGVLVNTMDPVDAARSLRGEREP